MSASASRPVQQPERFGRLWWLPFRGMGNGLSDDGWAPVADVDATVVRRLLTELRAANVPAHAAPFTGRPSGSRRRPPGHVSDEPKYRLWVGTSAYSRAEDVLRIMLPVLLKRARS